jgi:hypothetical protein
MKLNHAPKPPPGPETKAAKRKHEETFKRILGTWNPPKKARREDKST